MASLLYGTGLYLMECARLRVKDVEFSRHEIIVRDGKGGKDRVTMLPASLVTPLQSHLKKVKLLHARDLAAGFGDLYLPFALAQKYPNAGKECGWQYVFQRASVQLIRIPVKNAVIILMNKPCSGQ